MTTLNDFLTTTEAATALSLHPQTIKRLCRLGKLKGEKVNNGWPLNRNEIDAFATTYSETRGRPANVRVYPNGGSGWQSPQDLTPGTVASIEPVSNVAPEVSEVYR